MKEFYVYGLVDPRTNSIFYIGKGKGKRVFEHLSSKLKDYDNPEKLKVIEEIFREGFKVKKTILGENLSESSALLLEKLLVYRFGRKIFQEGNLTNIKPGGDWVKDDSLFLKEKDLPSNEKLETSFSELIPILEKYPHIAKDSNLFTQTIYEYHTVTREFKEYTIDDFIEKFYLGAWYELFDGIINTSEPVFCLDRIWQNYPFKNIEDISRIPFKNYDIINFDFVRRVNFLWYEKDEFLIEDFYPNGEKRIEMKVNTFNDELTFIYYFPNKSKKHITSSIMRFIYHDCSFYPTGNLKQESFYKDNGCFETKCYFENGNIEMSIIKAKDNVIEIKEWNRNGQLKESSGKNSK